MFTATWILRRAIVIATSLNSSPATVRLRNRSGTQSRRAGAGKRAQKGREDRAAHVGFYLIDEGRPAGTRVRRAMAVEMFCRTKYSQVSLHLLRRRNFSVHALATLNSCTRRRRAASPDGNSFFARSHFRSASVNWRWRCGTGSPPCCLIRDCCPVSIIHPAGSRRTVAAWSLFPRS